MSPMRAMVFGAGFGTRMRPLSEHCAKPAMPVCGHPILHYAFATLRRAGIREVMVNTHHRPEDIQRAVEAAERFEMDIRIVHEAGQILGTGGGLYNVRDFLAEPGEPFVVMNGDTLIELDLAAAVQRHRTTGACATMVLREDPRAEAFGALGFDTDGRIWDFVGRAPVPESIGPLSRALFTGVHVFEPEIFELMGEGFSGLGNEVYPAALVAGRPIFSFLQTGYWSDLGTPARYHQASLDLLAGEAPDLALHPAAGLEESPPGIFHPAGWTRIHYGEWLAPALVGRDVEIGKGAELGPGVVLGDGVRVGPSVRMERTVAWPGTEIPEGRHYSDVVLAMTGTGALLEVPAVQS